MGFKYGLRRTVEVTVAAFDTPPERAVLADFKCDGVEDEIELQAAIDTGQPVRALDGGFNLASGLTIVTPGQRFVGAGPQTVFHPGAFAALDDVFEVTGAGAVVEAFKVDGSGANGNVADVIDGSGVDVTIRGVVLADLLNGIFNVARLYSASGLIDSCRVENCDGTRGISVGASAVAVGCVVESHAGSRDFEIAGTAIGCQSVGSVASARSVLVLGGGRMLGGQVYGSAAPFAVEVDTGSGQVVMGNRIEQSQQVAVLVDGAASDGVLVGNVIAQASLALDNTYDAIVIEGDRFNVQNNTVRHSGIATQPRYGIRVEASANDNLVTNNDLLNSGRTGSFSNVGVGTITAPGNRL